MKEFRNSKTKMLMKQMLKNKFKIYLIYIGRSPLRNCINVSKYNWKTSWVSQWTLSLACKNLLFIIYKDGKLNDPLIDTSEEKTKALEAITEA